MEKETKTHKEPEKKEEEKETAPVPVVSPAPAATPAPLPTSAAPQEPAKSNNKPILFCCLGCGCLVFLLILIPLLGSFLNFLPPNLNPLFIFAYLFSGGK